MWNLLQRYRGLLLVGALIVVPVLAGQRLVKGLRAAIFAAAGIGVASSAIGLVLAFYTDVSAGGATVLVAVGLLILVEAIVRVRRGRREMEPEEAVERHVHVH